MKIGLILNPWAGLGGQAALKGSDDPNRRQLALASGFTPTAPARAVQALAQLTPVSGCFTLLSAPGPMGADAAREAGLSPVEMGQIPPQTTAEDTIRLARQLVENGIDLLLFAGGDGTARDIARAVGPDFPCIGIPCGVKMHSGVYAITPAQAGALAQEVVQGRPFTLERREVMDIDEEQFAQGRVCARLYGFLSVPSGGRMQHTKESSHSTAQERAALCEALWQEMDPGRSWFIGPGSTTASLLENRGLPYTLLGVDVWQDGRVILQDADEHQLWQLCQNGPCGIVVTSIGGQGHLFGRGNQQLSPRVLRAVGREHILPAVPPSKLAALQGAPLLTDTGDPSLDQELCGFWRLPQSPGQAAFYRVSR